MTPDANLLANFPLLQGVSRSALRALVRGCAHYCVPSGSPLFLDKEPAETLWFVVSGSLGVFRAGHDGASDFIGHIRPGEPVGEFALLAGEPHSGSVFALRDSEVIGIGRPLFEALIARHPEVMSSLTRTILFRARANRRKNPRLEPRVFALLNTSSSIDIHARAEALAKALHAMGKTALIVGRDAHHYDSAWFDKAERAHDIILLVSDSLDDNWAHVCQRRADRRWIFGRAELAPTFTFVERGAATTLKVHLNDVVLVRAQGARAPSQAAAWKQAASAQRVFFWGDGEAAPIRSLARIMAGNSVGLVLGGGGARAYAHIGAVRALREAGHSFDFVGGTSMGGVIAACLAMGWDDGEIERRIWDAFVRSSPLDDFILPVISLTAGRKVDQRLAHNFGHTRIEDLQIPFFCVSTNLTTGLTKVHEEGDLVRSLRASIALPGILPPVVWDDDVLVDGAVLNNFPVSAMRARHRGPTIGVDVTQQHALNPDDFRTPISFLRWALQHGLKSPPPIAELLMRSATANVATTNKAFLPDFLIVPQLDGVELRDWKAFDKAVEAGYSATTRALQSLPDPLRLA